MSQERCFHGQLLFYKCMKCEEVIEKREQAQAELNKAAIEMAKWLEGSEFKLEETQIVLSRAATLGLIEEEGK